MGTPWFRVVIGDRCSRRFSASQPPPDRGRRQGDGVRATLTDARFIVTVEQDRQFFGVLLPSGDEASALEQKLAKVPGLDVREMCAEPPATRELKIDLKTGNLIP